MEGKVLEHKLMGTPVVFHLVNSIVFSFLFAYVRKSTAVTETGDRELLSLNRSQLRSRELHGRIPQESRTSSLTIVASRMIPSITHNMETNSMCSQSMVNSNTVHSQMPLVSISNPSYPAERAPCRSNFCVKYTIRDDFAIIVMASSKETLSNRCLFFLALRLRRILLRFLQ